MKNGIPSTTNEFLDALKSLNNQASDYKLAQILEVKNPSAYKWRAGKSFFDDLTCEKVAKLLNLPLPYVLACVHAERAKTESLRLAWQQAALALAA